MIFDGLLQCKILLDAGGIHTYIDANSANENQLVIEPIVGSYKATTSAIIRMVPLFP